MTHSPDPTASQALVASLPADRLICEFSLWSANLCNLEADLRRTDSAADMYHVDVADGRFAPAFLFFPDLVARIRALTQRPIHVHLMVEDDIVLEQVRQFAAAGADLISVHPENGPVVAEAIDLIAELGRASGIVLRLETPVEEIRPWLDRVAFVTLLGTAIGVMGQSLSDTACPRLVEATGLVRDAGRQDTVRLIADGGIREATVPRLRAAGAEGVVLGSLAFGAPDLSARMAWLHGMQRPDIAA